MVELRIKVPEKFLEEEVRCGYKVTRQMKELWAVELDLFAEFDRVCRKHHLRYTADAGTLLGAIRHHGFIPWDDDIDVGMPRDDYEKFLKIGMKEFSSPYYLESFHSDSSFIYDKAKLLNLQTTGYENPFLTKHSIFIDIFPYDNIIEDTDLLETQGKELVHVFAKFQRVVACNNKWYCKEPNISTLRKIARYVEYYKMKLFNIKVGGKYHKQLFGILQSIAKRYNTQKTQYIGALAEFQVNVKDIVPTEDFDRLEWVDFEFLKMPVIHNYDEVLTRMYGDYNTFVKGGSVHTFKIIDTNRPYSEVLKEKGIML